MVDNIVFGGVDLEILFLDFISIIFENGVVPDELERVIRFVNEVLTERQRTQFSDCNM